MFRTNAKGNGVYGGAAGAARGRYGDWRDFAAQQGAWDEEEPGKKKSGIADIVGRLLGGMI